MPHTDHASPRIRTSLLIALGLSIALISLAGITATAQSGTSPAELRRENDRLKERIAELEAALSESERRIDRLEKQIAAQPQSPNTSAPQPETPSQPTPVKQPDPEDRRVPTTPSACPDALYESLVDRYNETFPGIERPALHEVQQWVRRVGRDHERTDWLVRIHDTKIYQGRMSSVLVNIIDPEVGDDICSNITINVAYKDAVRIRNATDVAYWIFEGTLTANPTADRTRPEFNRNEEPKSVGPYAVFGWSFEVDQIIPTVKVLDADTPEPPKR